VKTTEDQLRAIIDTIPVLAWSADPDGSADFFNQRWLEYAGLSVEEARGWGWMIAVHTDDLARITECCKSIVAAGEPGEIEARLRRADGEYRWFLFRASPFRDESGNIVKWFGTNTDIEDRKRAEDALRVSERTSRLIVDCIPGFVCTLNADGEVQFLNRQVLEYFGKTTEDLKSWATSDAVHPDDLPRAIDGWRLSIENGQPYVLELRQRRADGEYRWFQSVALPARDPEGLITAWYMLLTDIDDRKRAEDDLRATERDLRLIFDSIPGFVWTMSAAGEVELVNPQMLAYFGMTLDALKEWPQFIHPDDRERVVALWRRTIEAGQPYDVEHRLRRADGIYRWFQVRGCTQMDADGHVIRWYNLVTDIDERKHAEALLADALAEVKLLKDELYQENLALKEEVDQVSMFEEIVGSSQPLQKVLAQVAKVAPTDSTVLILGETGTGKELIARAIHKRSKRSRAPFIRVNCAAIPQSLIQSELFGHERGAFTGAFERRIGRFEAANRGTLFLDEVGELPMETQLSLLRVLQEQELERVGSSQPIPIDVRVVAATNRDLETAMANGTFRRDLYFRLNVVPLDIPSLRERADDIPMLVEYLIERYAKKAGKRFDSIRKKTQEQLQAYDWPGNIRELQNVIERAVVLLDGGTFSIDETWLKRSSPLFEGAAVALDVKLVERETEMIEVALRNSNGRVSGPLGAAIKLGIPRQTLDSRILSLKIDKRRFKTADGK
jgi:formate hydrogenlyase transcriptional activator